MIKSLLTFYLEFSFVYLKEKNGMKISGLNEELNLVEIIELTDHPWYVAGQFHPELKSRVSKAHPLFREFIKASVNNLKRKNK